MATFVKRGRSWRAQIVRKGQRVNASFDTRAEAERWAIHTEAAILEGAKIETAKPRIVDTVKAMFERYSADVSPTKRGCRWEQIRLKMLARDFPVFQGPVADLDASALADWRDQRLKAGKSAHTVNRELNLVSAVINVARKEWRVPGLKSNPVHDVTRPAIPKPRTQRVSEEQRAKIIEALGWDGISQPETAKQWVAFAFSLGIETAMRKGEIARITWENIRLEKKFIHLPLTKNGTERNVPISTKAVALIIMLKQGAPGDRLIPVEIGNIDKLMREARDKTNLRAVRFHDTRREATTRLAKKLRNVLELSEVTGHKSLQVLKGYYRPDPTELAEKLD